jgi:hypothetical protein
VSRVETAAPANPARPPDGIASDASVELEPINDRPVGIVSRVETAAPANPARPPDGIASHASVELEPINDRPLGI